MYFFLCNNKDDPIFYEDQLIFILCFDLKSDFIDKLFLCVWFFYPFRIGRQGDMTDSRTNSFLYILDILPR